MVLQLREDILLTSEQLLQKALEKARSAGWSEEAHEHRFAGRGFSAQRMGYETLIFSHDFAKAFWGDEMVHHVTGKAEDLPSIPWIREIAEPPVFKWHLQMMVLEPDPLQYLARFLDREEPAMTDQTITPVGIDANLAPDAFHRWAHHYYLAKRSFPSAPGFSPVPYFLLCRGIELELKSRLLHKEIQKEVRRFGHKLIDVYKALPAAQQILTSDELKVLQAVSPKYAHRDLEYFCPQDAATGFRSYPDLATLDAIARKLIEGEVG